MVNTKVSSKNTLVSTNRIPIIDLENKVSASNIEKSWIVEKAKILSDALSANGFIFITNHGISEEKQHSVYDIMETFCSLPDEVREQYKVNASESVYGYVAAGGEVLVKGGGKEMKHAYNFAPFVEKLPTKEISNFREVVGGVSDEFIKLANFLLRVIATAFDADPEKFINLHKGMMKEKSNNSNFRMLYYPPLEEELPANVTRCGEHTDWGTFTLLTQNMDGGLEVFQDGEWRRVGHLPGAVLMNVGDIMEVWSSSKFKSARHRVVVPEEVSDRTKGRHSTAFFVQPDRNTLVDPSVFKRCQSGNQVEDNLTEGQGMCAFEYIKQKQIRALEV